MIWSPSASSTSRTTRRRRHRGSAAGLDADHPIDAVRGRWWSVRYLLSWGHKLTCEAYRRERTDRRRHCCGRYALVGRQSKIASSATTMVFPRSVVVSAMPCRRASCFAWRPRYRFIPASTTHCRSMDLSLTIRAGCTSGLGCGVEPGAAFTVRGELAYARIDLPPTLTARHTTEQFGFTMKRWGRYSRPIFMFSRASLLAVVRLDWVDLHRGQQSQRRGQRR